MAKKHMEIPTFTIYYGKKYVNYNKTSITTKLFLTNRIVRPEYEYEHIQVNIIWRWKNTNTFGLKFVSYYDNKYTQIQFFRQMQIQIYLGSQKMGQYEYKYNYLDWYLIIQIFSHPPKKTYIKNILKDIQVGKLMHIYAIIYHLCYLVLQKKIMIW